MEEHEQHSHLLRTAHPFPPAAVAMLTAPQKRALPLSALPSPPPLRDQSLPPVLLQLRRRLTGLPALFV